MTLSFRNAFSNYFEAYEVAFYPASIASIKQILIQGHPKTHFAGAPAQCISRWISLRRVSAAHFFRVAMS